MTVALPINKVTSIKKQSALGTAASGASGTVLTRRSNIFSMQRDTFESDVKTQHQQSTGIAYGMRRPQGKIDSLLSTETFQLLLAGLLRKDFAAGATTGALTNVTATLPGGTPPLVTFTRAAGSYLTDGFKIGDVIRWTGWATTGTANNSRNFWITALSALVMTGFFLDGTAGGAKAAGDSVTGVVQGKKTRTPTSAHTNDYFTIEEYYADLTRSEVFSDVRPNMINLGFPPGGNATFGCDLLALGRTRSGSQVLTSPTEPTFREMTSVNGRIYVNSTFTNNVTALSLQIDGGGAVEGPVFGSNNGIDVSRNIIKVSGSLSAKFDGVTLQDLLDNETAFALNFVVTEDETATSAFMGFTLGKVKFTSDEPDDGTEGVVRTYPFTAEYNDSGGTAVANDATILSVQDSQL